MKTSPFFRLIIVGVIAISWISQTTLSAQEATTPITKPKIVAFPDAAVWTDRQLAAKEFPGWSFVGEYVKGDQALQVTPAEGRFYVSTYRGGLPGDGWDGGEIVHQWGELDAMEALLSGWRKVDRSSMATGKPAPENAIVLFDGTDTKRWNNGKIESGFLKAGTRTKQEFKDFRLYLEFLIPMKPEPPISHPHRGNSGVFAVGAYEVQISDTFGLDLDPSQWKTPELLKPVNTWCGSIYGIQTPRINMCLPPLTWQSFEIDFKAARFIGNQKVSSAIISVIHNGIKIHDNFELPEGTGGGPSGPRPEVAMGPIYLQDHGNANRFRNVWIVPNL